MSYELSVGYKTRALNLLRFFFKNKFAENIIAKSKNKSIKKLTPPNYLYKPETYRQTERHGINYSLDISNTMEHHIYFDLDPKERDNLFKKLRNDFVIVDVGVNVGETLLNFAKYCNKGFVYGFEPDSDNIKKALKNISLNGYKNIKLENLGLGDKESSLKLYKVNTKNTGMNRVLENDPKDEFEFEVINVITLDQYMEINNISKVDLLKIDVEGYEYHVLKGAANTIRNKRPILYIELDDKNLKENGHSAQSLINLLKGYKYSLILSAVNSESIDTISLENCHLDILCIPDSANF